MGLTVERERDRRRSDLRDLAVVGGIFVAWIVVQLWVLPLFGVST